MPVPGPRGQLAPLPGFRNPEHERPTRIQFWLRPGRVVYPGRTPGTMVRSLRGMILAAGQIRRDYHQSIDYIGGQAPYSWTRGTPTPEHPSQPGAGYAITRALRYMTRSIYIQAGTDNTEMWGLHSQVRPSARTPTPTLSAGARRNPPTVRNRLSSFGSRAPTLNQPVNVVQEGS